MNAFVVAAGPDGRRRGRFPLLDAVPGLVHAVTTRDGPDLGAAPPASVAHAALAAQVAGPLGVEAAWAEQVHGATVLRVDAPGCAGSGDALWTDRPGLAVLARSADCPLVLVAGARSDGSPLWGVAHASWRSTVSGIAARLVAALRGAGAEPETLRAAIAPSAGPCCYEVGEEVRERALMALGSEAAQYFVATRGRPRFDLWAANLAQLREAGVNGAAVSISGVCTLCRNDLFYSHRHEGDAAGRFAAIIGRRRLDAGDAIP